MSTAPGLFSIPDKARRRSACHRRTDSGELDVFEAERYFSTPATENNTSHTTTHTITIPHKIGIMSTRELEHYNTTSSRRQLGNLRQGRASLDMPRTTKHHSLSHPQNILLDHQPIKPNTEKKKHKQQPSSPGGKLANFFNSLINQTVSSKKKKSTKSGSQSSSVKDIFEEDNSPSGWRRRRRSSIGHFGTTTNSSATTKTTGTEIDAKSIKSCSGFRTPPPYMINTPIKPHKEFKTDFSKYTNSNSSATTPKPKSGKGNLDWLDEKFKIVDDGLSSEKHSSSRDFREAELESTKLKTFMEEDGDESDSSSDLFELQLNYDHHRHRQLGYCASDLPVYETTHMDTIKISSTTPITNGPLRN